MKPTSTSEFRLSFYVDPARTGARQSSNRGVQDILIACVDGLKGFPEAIEAVYPRTAVQLCIVHLVRASLNYVP
jgi:transposase-like protein